MLQAFYIHIGAGAGAEKFKPSFSQAILQSPAFFPEREPGSSSDEVYENFKNRLGVDDLEELPGEKHF